MEPPQPSREHQGSGTPNKTTPKSDAGEMNRKPTATSGDFGQLGKGTLRCNGKLSNFAGQGTRSGGSELHRIPDRSRPKPKHPAAGQPRHRRAAARAGGEGE